MISRGMGLSYLEVVEQKIDYSNLEGNINICNNGSTKICTNMICIQLKSNNTTWMCNKIEGTKICNKLEGNNGICKKLESNKLKGDGNYSLELLFTDACPLTILKLNVCHSSNLFERLNHFNEHKRDNDNKFEKEIESDIDSQ